MATISMHSHFELAVCYPVVKQRVYTRFCIMKGPCIICLCILFQRQCPFNTNRHSKNVFNIDTFTCSLSSIYCGFSSNMKDHYMQSCFLFSVTKHLCICMIYKTRIICLQHSSLCHFNRRKAMLMCKKSAKKN